MVKIRIPATTANLGPGFDTLGMSLDIYNEIEAYEIKSGLKIELEGYGVKELAIDENNLVYKSMKRVFDLVNYAPKGLCIRLNNKIPLARGLGSSAAAIVGGLFAANKLSGERLSIDELLNLATEIEGHPDNVAPALLGGVVISTVKEGDVIYKKIGVPDFKAVVCIPDYQLSTTKSRQILPERVNYDDAVFNLSNTALLVMALVSRDYKLMKIVLEDKLHQPYREALVPGLGEILAKAKEFSLGAVISGSGPTVVSFVLENEDEIGERMVSIFAKNNIKASYLVTSPIDHGIVNLD